MKFLLKNILLLIILLQAISYNAYASLECPSDLTINAFNRPLDYNAPEDQYQIKVNVEKNHFTKKVENLISGEHADIPIDIHFMLRVCPNHYRALNSMAKYQLLKGPPDINAEYWTADCYFKRALLFKPKDWKIYYLYGIYEHKKNNYKEALEKYQKAYSIQENNSELNYNMGLLYFDLNNYDKAREHAQKAYNLGYPLPGLKNMLKSVNKW